MPPEKTTKKSRKGREPAPATGKHSSTQGEETPAAAKGGTKFNPEWLTDPLFKDWIAKVDPYTFQCKFCVVAVNVFYDGKRAVTCHANSKKHTKAVRARGLMHKMPTIDTYCNKKGTKEETAAAIAECSETFHSIKHHQSFRSLDCGVKVSFLQIACFFIYETKAFSRQKL